MARDTSIRDSFNQWLQSDEGQRCLEDLDQASDARLLQKNKLAIAFMAGARFGFEEGERTAVVKAVNKFFDKRMNRDFLIPET